MRMFVMVALAVAVCACGQQAPGKLTATPAAVPLPAVQSAPPPPPKIIKKYEGPFGLAMGISAASLLEDFGFILASESSTDYYVGTPPRPVAGLVDYFAIATAGHGICRVGASEDVGVVNGSGDQLKAAVDKLAAALEVKYGKETKKYDFAKEDVYTRNPQYWMLGLKEKSVFYAYVWGGTKGGAGLPYDLESIEVAPTATSLSSGYVSVRYTFSNFKECGKDMQKAKASNL